MEHEILTLGLHRKTYNKVLTKKKNPVVLGVIEYLEERHSRPKSWSCKCVRAGLHLLLKIVLLL